MESAEALVAEGFDEGKEFGSAVVLLKNAAGVEKLNGRGFSGRPVDRGNRRYRGDLWPRGAFRHAPEPRPPPNLAT
jgi:hypothetical protein